MSEWPMVKLGEVISRVDETEQILKPEDETFVTLKLHGKGVVPRNIGDGKTPKSFRGFRVKLGQFIYSRIDARNGAFGIIPAELDGAVVSKDFPVYEVDSAEIMPSILISICTSEHFVNQIRSMSNGATNRQRIKEDVLERMLIPLPPLGEQKRIAEILGGVSKAINEIRTEIKRVESLCGAVVSLYAEDQSTKKLEDLATLSGGLSLGSHRKNKPHSVGYLRVANVFWGKILYDEIKELNCTDQEFERTLLQDGDVLITEAHANRFQVGRSAVFRGEEQALVFQNHLFRARPNKNIDSDVLAAMLSSVAVRRQLYQMAKTTSGLNTISISQVRSLRVPVLDTTKQAELLSFLQESNKLNHLLHRKLSLLQELQKSLASRAFTGLL